MTRFPQIGPVTWPFTIPGVGTGPPSGSGATLYPEFTLSGTGPFVVGFQVTNASTLASVTGRYWVRLTNGTTDFASDATDTITLNTGTTLLATISDGVVDVLTDSSGFAEIEVDAAADRWVSAAVGMEKAYSTGELTYVPSGPTVPGSPMGLLLALTYA